MLGDLIQYQLRYQGHRQNNAPIPEDVLIQIPGAYAYVTLPSKNGSKVADRIKVASLPTLN